MKMGNAFPDYKNPDCGAGKNEAPVGLQPFYVPSMYLISMYPCTWKVCHHYRQMLITAEFDPYMVTRNNDGLTAIGCDFYLKKFGTLKG
ncbi:hypothetical protein LOAG_08184 [Loa loa]|uniref:Uncharacterized protein n=1 Tax=Loa loa TaxID=7209 RepID=A0A1S0TUZ5_LOALO|nr:hypothetical protein LOAG_08184 [Loa loa]EFO20304.1 hypothetical protein LOAG_08184 [Loa loa]